MALKNSNLLISSLDEYENNVIQKWNFKYVKRFDNMIFAKLT